MLRENFMGQEIKFANQLDLWMDLKYFQIW